MSCTQKQTKALMAFLNQLFLVNQKIVQPVYPDSQNKRLLQVSSFHEQFTDKLLVESEVLYNS